MAARKKTTKRKAQVDHSGAEKDRGHTLLTVVIGPLEYIRKKGKRRKAKVSTKEVKAYLKKVIAQL